MIDIAAIRTGLADRLETLDLAAVYGTVPDRVVVPSAAVIPGDPFIEFHQAMGGLNLCRFDVVLFAARFDSHAGQDTLDDLIGRMVDALEADQTLNGSSSVVHVTETTNYGVVTVADTALLGCRVNVEVHAA